MAFVETLEVELGPFARVGRLTRKGAWVLRIYSWTQVNTDGGGTIETNIGTTPGNGKVMAVLATSNVVDKDSSASFVEATGVVTIVNNSTAGPTAGWALILILKVG